MNTSYSVRLRHLLWGTSALACLLATSALAVYLNCPDQFTISLAEAILAYVAFLLFASLAGAGLLACFKNSMTSCLPACLLALCLNVFLQRHFWSEFFIDYVPNSVLDWDFLFQSALNLLLLAVPFYLGCRFRQHIHAHQAKIFSVILLSQACFLFSALIRFQEPEYNFKEYSFSEQDKFAFGQQENAIILVVDCMGEGIFKEALETYPELKEILQDFTCFDRMISPLPRTMYAVPAMMTGIDFPRKDMGVPADVDHSQYLKETCTSDTSIFQVLRKHGFRIEGYPFLLPTISYAPEVIDNSIPAFTEYKLDSIGRLIAIQADKVLPCFLKLLLQHEDLPFLTFQRPHPRPSGVPRPTYDQTFHNRLSAEAQLGPHHAVFKYLHLQGAHEPVLLDENLQRSTNSLKIQQLRGSLKNVELLIRTLKKLELYDQAHLMIVGDHTERYTIHNVACIKRRHEQHDTLQFNSVPCQVSDIAGTLLADYRLTTPLPSLFNLKPVASDGSVRPEQVRYLHFEQWQADNQFDPEELAEDNPASFRQRITHDGHLVIEDLWYVPTSALTFFLRPEPASALIYTVSHLPRRDVACLKLNFSKIPDGTYTLFLRHEGLTVFDEQLGTCLSKCFPTLVIRQGKAQYQQP